MHMTCLLAAANFLAKIKDQWKGTLIVLFQPNEERGGGANAMVKNDLYNIVPVPDYVMGQHVMALRAGTVGSRAGTIMTASNRFKITLYGRGGHGSMPHRTIDPAVLAANVVVRLQTIVSREVDPFDMAVVTGMLPMIASPASSASMTFQVFYDNLIRASKADTLGSRQSASRPDREHHRRQSRNQGRRTLD